MRRELVRHLPQQNSIGGEHNDADHKRNREQKPILFEGRKRNQGDQQRRQDVTEGKWVRKQPDRELNNYDAYNPLRGDLCQYRCAATHDALDELQHRDRPLQDGAERP